jgi:sodium transport system ATP-binding protein
MIEASNLSKRFGDVDAITNVSLSAQDGKITALLGPNGAGKSTTLRVLYTVIAPTTGTAFVDGVNVVENPFEARQRIGALPHAAGLYERLTAIENVRYYGELHGLRGAALRKRVEHLVDLLEMNDFATRRVAGFSHGQRLKVALARALVHEPQNVLLDEPTNGLDVMATRALREIIIRLKADGRCVLFSSHVMQEVQHLCDDVVIIGGGAVRFQGALTELLRHTRCDDLEQAFVQVVESSA